MSFEIRQLCYAIAAADHGSFYRAARALEIEQSTISRNVLKLERVIGARLFDRSRAGVRMTTIGKRFVDDARLMVDQSERMVRLARAGGRGRAGAIIFGHNTGLSASNLRRTLAEWRNAQRDVDMDGVEASRDSLFSSLDSGSIDIAFQMGEAEYKGLQRASLWSERLIVALPAGHILTARPVVHWSDLRDEIFVLPCQDPGPDICNVILRCLSAVGFSPNIRMRSLSRETIMSFLGVSGDISVTLSDSLGVVYPAVVLRDLHDSNGQINIGYSVYWRRDNTNPVLRRFLCFLESRYALSFDIPT